MVSVAFTLQSARSQKQVCGSGSCRPPPDCPFKACPPTFRPLLRMKPSRASLAGVEGVHSAAGSTWVRSSALALFTCTHHSLAQTCTEVHTLKHTYTHTCARLVVSDSATLWTVAHQAPPSMGFSRQESQRGLPFPSSGDLQDPGIEPAFLTSPARAGWSFTTKPPAKPTQASVPTHSCAPSPQAQ